MGAGDPRLGACCGVALAALSAAPNGSPRAPDGQARSSLARPDAAAATRERLLARLYATWAARSGWGEPLRRMPRLVSALGYTFVDDPAPPGDPIGLGDVAFASRNEAALLLARLAAGDVDLTLYGHIHSYYPLRKRRHRGDHQRRRPPERFDGIGRHFLVVDLDPGAGTSQVRVLRVD
jgi:hypothetical protein